MKIPDGRGRRRFLADAVATGLALSLTSCGTLLYPERRGQPVGRLDLGVVALDGVGLLLFFVPGVIAFAVDFATGAIFLPPDYALADPATGLRQVRLDPSELTRQRVEAVVRERTGKAVSLQPGDYRAVKVGSTDELTPENLAKLEAEAKAARVTFRAGDE